MCIRDERFWKTAVACELPGHFSEESFVTERTFDSPFASWIGNRRNRRDLKLRSPAATGLLAPEASNFLAVKAVANKRTKCNFFPDIWNSWFACKFCVVWVPSPVYSYEKGKMLQIPQFYITHNSVQYINAISVNHMYVSEMCRQWQKDGHQSLQTEHTVIAAAN